MNNGIGSEVIKQSFLLRRLTHKQLRFADRVNQIRVDDRFLPLILLAVEQDFSPEFVGNLKSLNLSYMALAKSLAQGIDRRYFLGDYRKRVDPLKQRGHLIISPFYEVEIRRKSHFIDILSGNNRLWDDERDGLIGTYYGVPVYVVSTASNDCFGWYNFSRSFVYNLKFKVNSRYVLEDDKYRLTIEMRGFFDVVRGG